MTIPQLIRSAGYGAFSFEVLPPLKGRGISRLFEDIDSLMPYKPLYINITTHRSEVVVRNSVDGHSARYTQRSRPGTVAVAAAIRNRYNIPAVPHLICSGYTAVETEYALIDLSFLDIRNLLILRGDKAKHHICFVPNAGGHSHALQLETQVKSFNEGYFIDGTEMDSPPAVPFDYGVAGYPEGHMESGNLDTDMCILRQKVDAGASYIVTQMFFDNGVYFDFVERCHRAGISVPVIPGLKPIVSRRQARLLPDVFGIRIPETLVDRLDECSDDAEAKKVGIDWCTTQARMLYDSGVPSIHYYSHNAVPSVRSVLENLRK